MAVASFTPRIPRAAAKRRLAARYASQYPEPPATNAGEGVTFVRPNSEEFRRAMLASRGRETRSAQEVTAKWPKQ
jgi:hypothetical protein